MKKCVSILLALAMCVLCVPAGVFELPASAAPATMTTADVTRNIENYWNIVTENGTKAAYWNRNKSESQLISEADSGDYLASISRSPCSVASGAGHLRANGCTSNTFKGGSQCNGFAAYMEYVGCGVTSHKQGEYFHEVDDSFLFQPGDRLWLDWRSNGTEPTHAIFIYKVENDTVFFIEANWGGYCHINRRSASMAEMRGYVNKHNTTNNWDYVWRPNNVISCNHSYKTQQKSDGSWAAFCQNCGQEYIIGALNTADAGTYRATKRFPIAKEPYKESQYIELDPMEIEIEGSIINAYGNLWYHSKYGDRWIYSGYLELVQKTSTLGITGAQYPSGDLKKGNYFILEGTISSNYNLTNISAHIYNSAGNDAISAYSQRPNKTSYNIRKEGLDDHFAFGSLAVGSYTYVVSATDESGTTKELIRSAFNIVDNSTNPVAPNAPTVSVDGSNVTVSWNDVANETGYDVYLVQEPWGWNDIKYSASVGAGVTSYTFSNVAAGYYCAFVISRPNDNSVQSEWSEVVVAGQSTTDITNADVADLVRVAEAALGKTRADLGLPQTAWCGYFVGYCINHSTIGSKIGSIPNSSCAFAMDPVEWVCETKQAGVFYCHSAPHAKRLQEFINFGPGRLVEVSAADFTPQVGDIVELTWETNWDLHHFDHVGIVTGVTDSEITYISGNAGSGTQDTRKVKYDTRSRNSKNIYGYIRFDAEQAPAEGILNLDAVIDGVEYGWFNDMATVDVYINGVKIAEDWSDFYDAHPVGSTYEIKDIRPKPGFSYDGIWSGSRTGTIGAGTVNVVLNISSIDTSSLPAPTAIKTWNGHEYSLFVGDYTWYRAKEYCEAMGGTLAIVDSAEENAVLWELCNRQYTWLGGTDQPEADEWYWVDGRPFSYTNWMDGQPDNDPYNDEGCENYLHLWEDGQWNDNCGSARYSFILEKTDERYIASGYCGGEGDGTNLSWTLEKNGTLTISGSGMMVDCYDEQGYHSPWRDWDTEILSVVINSGVTNVADGAFWDCRSVTSVVIPEGVISIGEEAFYYCCSMNSINIPSTVTEIGRSAFSLCSSISSISIPDGVRRIEDGTFSACESLASITMPASVIFVGACAFAGCDGLRDVYYSGSGSDWDSIIIEEENDPLLNASIHLLYNHTHIPADPVRENEVAATCTADGSYDEVVYCTACGEELSRETKTIEKLGHDWGAWSVTKEASCAEAGEETRVCKRCDQKETRELAKLGHSLNRVAAKAPTATEAGNIEYYVCSVCCKLFRDAACKEEISEADAILAPVLPDLNGDGNANVTDAAELFAYVSGQGSAIPTGLDLDFNGDGKVSNKDAILYFRLLAGRK